MISGYKALTEKEKETLRLLVRGYDAKSTARHLNLSVHTVNERLRDARRKMSVSSSREAARLVQDAEGQDPDLLVPTSLGAAPDGRMTDPFDRPANRGVGWRRLGWAIGGVIMIFGLALLAYIATPEHRPGDAPTAVAAVAESVTVQAARRWLELGDAGDWKASYAATSASFRSVNSLERWQSASLSVRVPLGRVLSRQLIGDDSVPTPPNGNQVVRFRTSFANKPSAIETVALAQDAGQWRVVGIYIE